MQQLYSSFFKAQIPKANLEKFLFFYMVCGLPLSGAFGLFVVIPAYYPDYNFPPQVFVHVAIGFYVYFNIVANLLLMMVADVTAGADEDVGQSEASAPGGGIPAGWHFCAECNRSVPPRSHHCKKCNRCIVRRSHHCYFSGSCVGLQNHRYYLVCISHMIIGLAYGNLYCMPYMWQQIGGVSLTNVFLLFGPHVGYVIRYYSPWEFLIQTLNFMGLLSIVLLTWLMITQWTLAVRGQTTYERKKGIKTYDLGWRHNVFQLFGSRPIAVFFWPFVNSPPLPLPDPKKSQ